jgi:hypothetical protein
MGDRERRRGRGGEREREEKRERTPISLPLLRTPILWDQGSTLMTSFNINYFLKDHTSTCSQSGG